MKEETHKIPNNRLRLRVKLLVYNVNFEYLPVELVYVADFLRRNYIKRSEKAK